MKVPNAERAVIEEEKLCDYLLNVAHRRGGSKAKMLVRMGYSPEQWRRLESDIRQQHLTCDVDASTQTDYGTRYEIVAPLVGPTGRPVPFHSIWQTDLGTDYPRLITMYPE